MGSSEEFQAAICLAFRSTTVTLICDHILGLKVPTAEEITVTTVTKSVRKVVCTMIVSEYNNNSHDTYKEGERQKATKREPLRSHLCPQMHHKGPMQAHTPLPPPSIQGGEPRACAVPSNPMRWHKMNRFIPTFSLPKIFSILPHPPIPPPPKQHSARAETHLGAILRDNGHGGSSYISGSEAADL